MGVRERKEREKEKKRQAIMDGARIVFSVKGFNNATMEEIARQAEFSPGTLYLYFKNKDELSASLSLRILEYLNRRLEDITRPGCGELLAPEKKLEALQRILFDVYDFDPPILNHVFNLQASEKFYDLSSDVISEINALSQQSFRMMARIFKEGTEKGVFVDKHPVALAHILWSIFSGVVLLEYGKKKMDYDRNYLKQTLETAFHIFNRGVIRNS